MIEWSGGLIFAPEIPVFPVIFIVIMVVQSRPGAISGTCPEKSLLFAYNNRLFGVFHIKEVRV
jgi:hypothetical protein